MVVSGQREILKSHMMKSAVATLLCIIVVVSGVFVFWRTDGDDDLQFNAGAQSGYPPGSVTPFEEQHLILVRRSDGTFLALYDWDGWAQAQYSDGNTVMEACRVGILPKDSPAYEGDLVSIQNNYAPVEGLEDIVLRAGCGNVFDPLGRRAFGPAPGDLDGFPVSVNDRGDVIINLDQRRCDPASPCLADR